MEYSIVEATRWLQNDFFDIFFKVISWFGTEIFFLVVFVGLYWMYKREYALKFGLFYLVSVGVNSIVKLAVNRTRPNGRDHSFPSGHSQSIAMQTSLITHEVFSNKMFTRGKRIALLCDFIVVWIVVAYARLYLNFHFLTDVLGGLLIAILLTIVLNYLWERLPQKFKALKYKHIVQYSLIFVACALIIYLSVSAKMVEKMLVHDSYLTIYEIAGALIGACIGDMLNDKFVSYNPNIDELGSRVVKALLGFGFLALYYYFIIIRFAMKLIYTLPVAFMIMMFIATFVFPWLFKKWSNEDNRIKDFEGKNK